jgi:L-2,4-diaminobutyric acid acetyltransferase
MPARDDPETTHPIVIRTAEVEDGVAIHRLVRDSRVLDLNSLYSYLLVCRHFGDTCVVAQARDEEAADDVVGFVTAFKPPADPRTVFVWQVAVDASMRGRGLARRLLVELLALPACRGVRWLETTVTPDNEASRALFHSLARSLGTRCEVSPYFGEELIAGGDHEIEELHRIGPIPGHGPRTRPSKE